MSGWSKPRLKGHRSEFEKARFEHRRLAALTLAGTALLGACGAADAPAESTAFNLQAIVSVERAREAAGEESASGTALAQFLVLPADSDSQRTLDWAGLKAKLPEPTRCWRPAVESGLRQEFDWDTVDPSADPSAKAPPTNPSGFDEPGLETGSLELLAAGQVTIRAGEQSTELALNLFPPSGSAAGVLYSSRNRSAVPLPADEIYHIDVSGSPDVPELSIQAEAPLEMDQIRMNGELFNEAASFAPGEPLSWTWTEGANNDRVYVHLTDGELSVVCAFADSAGAGTVPAAFTSDFVSETAVRFGIHRIREINVAEEILKPGAAAETDATLVETTLRFDFEIGSLLHVE